MLILTRHRRESILIGREGEPMIEVKVIYVGQDTVKIGIAAPRETTRIRLEPPPNRP